LQGNQINGHLQVSDFRFKFPVLFPLRSGRKCVVAVSGNTLETRWTAQYFSQVISWICLHSFPCHWRFLCQQILTMNLVTLFMQHNGVFQAFSSRDHRLQAYKRRLRMNGIRCRIVKFAAGSLLKNSPRSEAGQLSRYDFNF